MKVLKKQSKIKLVIVFFILIIMVFLWFQPDNKVFAQSVKFDDTILHCKDGLYYRKNIFGEISERILEDGVKPDSYIAVKSLSQRGLSYLLLINYPDKTKLITYKAIGGFKSQTFNSIEGDNLFAKFATSNYKIANNNYDYDTYHTTCHFVRIVDTKSQYEFEVVESNIGRDIPSIKIVKNVKMFLNDLYDSEKLEDIVPQLALDLIEKDFNEFNKQLSDDLFYELKAFKSMKK